ncbi:hypothetical protein AVEN_204390-1 [Araneus ventricosus]|uniref:Alpha-latrotoxin n=1 Tax=Araneus ventricosus TaxID=182803 RepID=A0A4Y2KAX8_ARAVE|nr:hypothetical protein AVEN_204390-1 [Araneus ventricosus]
MTDLLGILVDKWQRRYSDKELDDILSQSYKELKLRKVSLTREMQFFVEIKILDLRFFHISTTRRSETGNSWEEIKKRIEMVVRYIRSIKTDYWDRDPDEKFILIAEFIAKNIHVLKFLLKSTYDRLPWEEIEFCLVIFIRCSKNPSEPNLVYNCVLNKKKMLLHLFNFSIVLSTQHDEFKNSNVILLSKSLNLPRDNVIDEITEKNSEFRELYDDYGKVRDFCSLEVIKSYAELIHISDDTEKRKHLLVSRVLQIMGEHLKNTLESPKLSTRTANALLSPLSFKTREIITNLRDALSHDDGLFIRAEIEKKTYLLKNLQTDISKIQVMITKMLYTMRIEAMKYFMKKIRLFQSFKDINEFYGPFQTSVHSHIEEIKKAGFNTSFKGDFQRLEELIFCLQKNLNDQTLSERILFLEIFDLLQEEKSGFEDLQHKLFLNSFVRSYVYDLSQKQSECGRYLIPALVDSSAGLEIPELPLEIIARVKKLVRELLLSVSSRIVPSRNLEVNDILWNISEFVNFQMGTVKWMDEFRETISENKIKINYTLSENLLTLKLSQLKEALTDFDLKDRTSIADFSAFEGNKELRAVTEMLVLDILGVLQKSCSLNQFFLDSDYLVLAGKNLRNHLAHGNTLIDVCLEESSAQILVNAKKLLTEVFSEDKKLDTVTKCDCVKLETTIEHDLRIISNQLKLFVALGEGNVKDAEECVSGGADVYGKDSNLWTCLHFAGKAPDCAALKWILRNDLDIDSKDRNDQTVLYIAAKFDNIQVVRYLVKQTHMSLDTMDANGKTPLHVAAENHSNEVVKYISNLSISAREKDCLG